MFLVTLGEGRTIFLRMFWEVDCGWKISCPTSSWKFQTWATFLKWSLIVKFHPAFFLVKIVVFVIEVYLMCMDTFSACVILQLSPTHFNKVELQHQNNPWTPVKRFLKDSNYSYPLLIGTLKGPKKVITGLTGTKSCLGSCVLLLIVLENSISNPLTWSILFGFCNSLEMSIYNNKMSCL